MSVPSFKKKGFNDEIALREELVEGVLTERTKIRIEEERVAEEERKKQELEFEAL